MEIEGLGQLSAAALVDASRVDPEPSELVSKGLDAAVADFLEGALAFVGAVHDVGAHDFIVAPFAGKNGVSWNIIRREIDQLQSCRLVERVRPPRSTWSVGR